MFKQFYQIKGKSKNFLHSIRDIKGPFGITFFIYSRALPLKTLDSWWFLLNLTHAKMVYNVTYRKIQDYNFQHVHESRLLPYRTRRSLHKIRGPNVLSDLCVSTGIGQPPIRTQTKIHPAPAFRAFSSSDVSKVVGRLYKNPSNIKRHSLPAVESRNCLSKERESELSARLMQPTVAAKIRMAILRVKPSESLPDLVRNSCDRLNNKGPSSRYYPGCYENVSERKFSYRYWNGSTSTF